MCLIYVTKNTTFHKRYCNIGTCPVNYKKWKKLHFEMFKSISVYT